MEFVRETWKKLQKRNKLHSQKVHHLAQVKRSVAKMDENAYNTASTTRPRIISPTELPRIDTEEQKAVERHDEDNEVGIVDMEGIESDGDDEEDDNNTEQDTILDDWTDELDRIDEQGIQWIRSFHWSG